MLLLFSNMFLIILVKFFNVSYVFLIGIEQCSLVVKVTFISCPKILILSGVKSMWQFVPFIVFLVTVGHHFYISLWFLIISNLSWDDNTFFRGNYFSITKLNKFLSINLPYSSCTEPQDCFVFSITHSVFATTIQCGMIQYFSKIFFTITIMHFVCKKIWIYLLWFLTKLVGAISKPMVKTLTNWQYLVTFSAWSSLLGQKINVLTITLVRLEE